MEYKIEAVVNSESMSGFEDKGQEGIESSLSDINKTQRRPLIKDRRASLRAVKGVLLGDRS